MTVGILGGGQLGRMLALAGYRLGLRFRVYDQAEAPCAADVADYVRGDFADASALRAFAAGLDVVTYEFENVPVTAARMLTEVVPTFPPPAALEAAQDRLIEKDFFRRLGLDTPRYRAVSSRSELDAGVAALGYPAVLKTRRFGYDGKGQHWLRGPADLDAAWAAAGGQPLILEGVVAFERELSILAVRNRSNAHACYPLIENRHAGGILRESRAPAPDVAPKVQRYAEQQACAVLDALEYVGVLAIEFFQADGRLVANEMAPRVHNSGHWTIDGAATSQFENHLRAILDLPLGSTTPRGVCVMLNLIGNTPPLCDLAAAGGGVACHLYGKAPRPGRKIGHLTAVADDAQAADQQLAAIRPLIEAANGQGAIEPAENGN